MGIEAKKQKTEKMKQRFLNKKNNLIAVIDKHKDDSKISYEIIAKDLGITRERVRQLLHAYELMGYFEQVKSRINMDKYLTVILEQKEYNEKRDLEKTFFIKNEKSFYRELEIIVDYFSNNNDTIANFVNKFCDTDNLIENEIHSLKTRIRHYLEKKDIDFAKERMNQKTLEEILTKYYGDEKVGAKKIHSLLTDLKEKGLIDYRISKISNLKQKMKRWGYPQNIIDME